MPPTSSAPSTARCGSRLARTIPTCRSTTRVSSSRRRRTADSSCSRASATSRTSSSRTASTRCCASGSANSDADLTELPEIGDDLVATRDGNLHERAGNDPVAWLESLADRGQQLGCDLCGLQRVDTTFARVDSLPVDPDPGANVRRWRLVPQRAQSEGTVPDVRRDDALEVVRRPRDIDELERGAVADGLAVGAARQRRLPLDELRRQRPRDTLVNCYETGTSASASSRRSACAFVAA